MESTCLVERYRLSTDKSEMNADDIYQMLLRSHWANNRTRQIVAKSIENSVCVGIFHNNKQVGIARAITDNVVLAFVLDVYVDEEHRGNGLAKQMMQALLTHPDLSEVKFWQLNTRDAHGLYRKFGFESIPMPERVMSLTK